MLVDKQELPIDSFDLVEPLVKQGVVIAAKCYQVPDTGLSTIGPVHHMMLVGVPILMATRKLAAVIVADVDSKVDCVGHGA